MEDFEKNLTPYLMDRETYVNYLAAFPVMKRVAWLSIATSNFIALMTMFLPISEGNDFRKQSSFDTSSLLRFIAVQAGEPQEAELAYDLLLVKATEDDDKFTEAVTDLALQPYLLVERISWLLHRTGYAVIFHRYSDASMRLMMSRASMLRAQLVQIKNIVQNNDWPPETASAVLDIMTALDDTSASYKQVPGDEAINTEEGAGRVHTEEGSEVTDWESWFKL